MKVPLIDLNGKVVSEFELPSFFETDVREDLIKRAVLSEESKEYQPKGAYRWAGLETSARYRGRKEAYGSLKNRGQAMLPREVRPQGMWGKVKRIPSAVGGRRAHPPKPEKVIEEKINKKEYLKAMMSALASTTNPEMVKNRVRVVNVESMKLPLVVVDEFENVGKTKEIVLFLEKVGLLPEVEHAKQKAKPLTGVRRRRACRTYVPKTVLIVVNEGGKAARNLPGVDVVRADELQVKHIAPGTHVGRVVIFTPQAIEKLKQRLEVM